MLNLLAIPAAVMPLIIFCLRVGDMSLDTLRVLFVVRGRKATAWMLGFFQSALWVVAITSVLSNLGNLWNLIGYAGGFATGNVVGMVIEEWLAVGHGHLRIISSRRGTAIAEAIRSAGYAATELSGRGKDGMVSVINCSVRRRDIDRVREQVKHIDPEAFLTVEEVRPLQRGFWRA
ncbi:MAG: hypothetical protein A2Z37_02845 [Chloroflexi bacterium RBG_19FT_COMBO_62_14]|nr:MAG: hypothetical protein A2Z37_02845 [Chloroflexi bacterium RBG_19FT_COMBO_62_14]